METVRAGLLCYSSPVSESKLQRAKAEIPVVASSCYGAAQLTKLVLEATMGGKTVLTL